MRPPAALVVPVARGVQRARRVWWWLRRPVTIGVRVAVEDPDGALLLVRHTYVRGWYLPGGGADGGETLPDAGAREVREETGIDLAEPPRLVTVQTFFLSHRTDHVALLHAQATGEPQVDGIESAEAAWFAPDALPSPLPDVTRRQLAALSP